MPSLVDGKKLRACLASLSENYCPAIIARPTNLRYNNMKRLFIGFHRSLLCVRSASARASARAGGPVVRAARQTRHLRPRPEPPAGSVGHGKDFDPHRKMTTQSLCLVFREAFVGSSLPFRGTAADQAETVSGFWNGLFLGAVVGFVAGCCELMA